MPLQAKEDRILLAEARLRQVDHRLLRVDHRRRQAALHRADLILRGLRAKGRPFLVSRVRRQASPTRRHRHRVLAARSILQAHRLQNRVPLQRGRSILPGIRLLVRPRVLREQMARSIHRDHHHQHHRQLQVSMQPEARRHQPARLLPASLLTAIVASLAVLDSAMQ